MSAVCQIETNIMDDYHIEPKNYNVVVNITPSGDVQLILNKNRIFQSLRNSKKIVGSINKKLNDLLSQIKIQTDDFAYLSDREPLGNVMSLIDKIVEKRLTSLESKENKKQN